MSTRGILLKRNHNKVVGQVHPCLCREYIWSLASLISCKGSSPHMRGIQKSKPKKHICSGFIPTHAGNIRPTAGTWCLLRVHPRPRGEYFYISAFYTSTKGSSPLARGILKQARTDSDMARFTPAYAGNTHNIIDYTVSEKVHPRLRGEYPIGDFTVSLPLGSPPLTRGIH